MPSLSWNTITDNARLFARDWANAKNEQADKQTFWNEFFQIFGISLRTVASFEEPVRRLRGTYGFIDLLWKGKLLVEHKSLGTSLEAAETQAFDYIQDLHTVGRGDEVPRYVLLSDFQRFALYDLEPDDQFDLPLFRDRFRYNRTEFPLTDLSLHVREFAFIPGYQIPKTKPQVDLNLKAVALMAGVHDTLKLGGFTGHELERLLVRILFCLFADKTGIFQPESFRLFVENRTALDGSNLGAQLNALFATLDKPEDKRQSNLDEDLRDFPWVNGALFKERLDPAAFTGPMRKALLNACDFRWEQISPAIFGALFQEVMNDEDRRKLGAHYTSERDILKVIRPLFLDKLREEFDSINKDRSGRRASRLEGFRVHLTTLKFLDPACGCGNFLVIAYRELRKLELEVLQAQHAGQQAFTLDEVNGLSQVDVHQFYGIEIEEWPARIAEVALWLMDHQANLHILETFSQPFIRLPLKQSPHIRIDNALRVDWNDLLPAGECSYVMGNPPFVGAKHLSMQQRADVAITFGAAKNTGVIDYVGCWYRKAVDYMASNAALAASFVSTNSITQGEQVSVLWSVLLELGLRITFAYRTFAWASEAKGAAHVHCVIVGFSLRDYDKKFIFESEESTTPTLVGRINPYLIDASDVLIKNRKKPLFDVPRFTMGNKPIDDGNYLFTPQQRSEFLAQEPQARPFFRLWLGAEEFLNGVERWFLWLGEADPSTLKQMPQSMQRVRAVQEFRARSKSEPTRLLARKPTRLHIENMPKKDYLIVPCHSSEVREVIPMAFVSSSVLAGNANLIMRDASLFAFGVLQSKMHMAWADTVCGRIKSDYRYSAGIVYNNFPWPGSTTEAQRTAVELAARSVLDARACHPDYTLAALYDPLLTPSKLLKAHQQLNRVVERCYRSQSFTSDRDRVEFLFALYETSSAPLLPLSKSKRNRIKRKVLPSDL